jgi:hypothetical protein
MVKRMAFTDFFSPGSLAAIEKAALQLHSLGRRKTHITSIGFNSST